MTPLRWSVLIALLAAGVGALVAGVMFSVAVRDGTAPSGVKMWQPMVGTGAILFLAVFGWIAGLGRKD